MQPRVVHHRKPINIAATRAMATPTHPSFAVSAAHPISSAKTLPLVKPAAERPPSTSSIALRPPHALPKILGIGLASHVIHSGQDVHAEVFTTSNVASVEARLASYGFNLTRVGVGHFALQYHVPDVPFYLKRDWPVSIIARNVDGRKATRQLTIVVQ